VSNVQGLRTPATGARGGFQLGAAFPFRSNSCRERRREPFPTLGQWISSKGGRGDFCFWLGTEAARLLADSWVFSEPFQAISDLACSDWEEHQLIAVFNENDSNEGELTELMAEAQQLWKVGFSGGGGTKRRAQGLGNRASAERPEGFTRCQWRNHQKKLGRVSAKMAKKRRLRRLACFRASEKGRLGSRGMLVVGTWNTRGLGAPKGGDPEGKVRALFTLMKERGWNCGLLTDLRFPEDGVCEVVVAGLQWLVVHYGKVGVALDPWLAARWRAGIYCGACQRLAGRSSGFWTQDTRKGVEAWCSFDPGLRPPSS
jgi:hypothetical protein